MPKNIALAIMHEGDGPWVRVGDVAAIVVSEAGHEDTLEIHTRRTGALVPRDPIRIRGSQRVDTIIPRGEARVVRVSGKTPITVMAEMRV